jgi:hypothetical protein
MWRTETPTQPKNHHVIMIADLAAATPMAWYGDQIGRRPAQYQLRLSASHAVKQTFADADEQSHAADIALGSFV